MAIYGIGRTIYGRRFSVNYCREIGLVEVNIGGRVFYVRVPKV